MDESSPVYHALLERRREIAGNILHLEGCVAKARSELIHLDAALEIMGFDVPERRKRPKQSGTAGLFHQNELPRLILQMLRGSPEGLSCGAMAAIISRDKGWDAGDKRFQTALADKISKKLTRMKSRYGLRCTGADAGFLWSIGE